MKKSTTIPLAKVAMLTLAEIKAAIEAFDRGEIHVLAALDTIVASVDAYRGPCAQRRKAA